MTDGDRVRRAGPLWAITSFFNPLRYERRLANYRQFRRHLEVPLVAVELGNGGQFQLTDNDAEILVQLPGRDVLWQKERLLNLARKALPPECKQVVWLDCDIVFGNTRWPEQLSVALDRFPLVRPYAKPRNERLGWRPAPTDLDGLPEHVRPLPRERILMLDHIDACRGNLLPAQPWGRAYAASRELFDAHGLYDGCIIGGGDVAMAFAACGHANEAAEVLRLAGPQRAHYLAWAHAYHDDVGGRVACLDGTLHHMWHGARTDRQYGERHVQLAAHAFDPARDIALSEHGVWQWSSDKPALHALVRSYFRGRREDG